VLLRPFLRLLRDGRLTALRGVSTDLKSFYRLTYLAAAGECGMLGRLSAGPATLESLAGALRIEGQGIEALEAWLQMGVRLRLLRHGATGYALCGLAAVLARPENDPALALVEEVAGLHHRLIAETLPKLRRGELWSLADQDGELIARSSRIFEAFQTDVICRTFPSNGALRLLEIGCGSGIYLQHAAKINPSLTAVGVELQGAVAAAARRNLREWGLEDRIQIEQCDIRAKAPDEQFDIATLYNNIYYFPVGERVALLDHVRRLITPGGFLLLITCCQGGSVGAEALNLWGAATRGAGRLPAEGEMLDQLRWAGFHSIRTMNLLPGDRFMAFQAFSP
jgi:SAM-dependent methyltransferase